MREATIHLSDADLAAFGIDDFVSLIRRAGVEQVTELQCQRPGCLLVVTVAEPISDAQIAEIDTVEWWEEIDRENGATYLCKLAVPAFDEGFRPHHETDVSHSEIESAGDGLDLTMVGKHEELSERIREYSAADAEPLLRMLGDYQGPSRALDTVTPRQREVLETAFEMGYFDVPRATTTAEIGAELDLDPSTVREHLRRAQRNLLSDILGSV